MRAWRAQHEPQILRELFELVAIPNVATDQADIARNAQALTRMFEKRRFLPETIPTGGSPLVVAERRVPGARRTLTFYFHYDGQPVDARDWTHGPPFTPVIVTDLDAGRAHAEARRAARRHRSASGASYGRSSSDDKVADRGVPRGDRRARREQHPADLEHPRADGRRGGSRLAEPRGGRPRRTPIASAPTRCILVDGPRHASDRPTLNFGSRGLMGAIITVYGASRDLHSGNYGNWAPNPGARPRPAARVDEADRRPRHRRRLLRRCRAADGGGAPGDRRDSECRGDADAGLRLHAPRERVRSGSSCATTSRRINVNAIEAGGGVGGQGRTIIPGSASAKIDVRLVKAIDPAKQFDRIVAHVRKQGYFVVDSEPDAAIARRAPDAGARRPDRRLSGRAHVDGDAAGRVDGKGAVGRRGRPARAAAHHRRQHAVLPVRGRARGCRRSGCRSSTSTTTSTAPTKTCGSRTCGKESTRWRRC